MADFKKDYLLIQMSNRAYDDHFPTPNKDWEVVGKMNDPKTGFAACAFKNPQTNEVVISYRGTDLTTSNPLKMNAADKGDIDADKAFAKDSTALGIASGMFGAVGIIAHHNMSDWHPQMDQALAFADKIMKENPDSKISVTGHSLGGGLAQVASQMYNLPGTTFDAPGALNVVHSDGFKNYAKAHGLPQQGMGHGDNLHNYTVKYSEVSGLTGKHVGSTQDITGYMADGTPVGKLDILTRHDRGRIEEVFELAAQRGYFPKVAFNDLPPLGQNLLANAGDQTRGLFAREGLDYDKHNGAQFTLAAAGLAADNNMSRIDMMGVKDKGQPTSELFIGQKEGLMLQTASMPTADVGKVTPEQTFQSLVAFAQTQEQPNIAKQQTQQQEQPQHKAPSIA